MPVPHAPSEKSIVLPTPLGHFIPASTIMSEKQRPATSSRSSSTAGPSRPAVPPRPATSLTQDNEYKEAINGLKKIYNQKIKPLEVMYNFEGFHSAPLTDADIEAKPMVLLIGQYSTGKTTFIRYLIDKSYPGEHIGVEPTTDRFVAVMNGIEEGVIPGNAAAVNAELPFRGLNKFGQSFLSRFQVSQTPSAVLENMSIIDTPGILAGDKQLIERGYDFTSVVEWFAERADLVLLLFDSHKLDISNEFKMAIHALRGHEEKVRVVLNKSDMVSQQQLMRVYGAMMWSLGKVVQTPEVMRVYLGSFWLEKPPNCFEDSRELLDAEQKDLLKDLRELPRNAAIRKINEIVKRARLAKVHAYIIGHLKKEMPSVFGKNKKQEQLVSGLDTEFLKIQQRFHLPAGDFPNVERFRANLKLYNIDKFKTLKEDVIERVDDALSSDLPRLMSRFPQGNPLLDVSQRNPFDELNPSFANPKPGEFPPSYWHFSSVDKASYIPVFQSLHPVHGKVAGAVVRPIFVETGLPNDVLAQIWRLADWDGDGYMDVDEFCVAMHLVKAVQTGGELPQTLPATMMPVKKL
ncbi:P-loop containing nucleoside triphosphate hydrolase protein [Endogone sp. FLAS-F59071]|nr:P-loop containing nucleoside triphosphate hydrolase protein [Endogone sp. FLAS-F59071]|eukprot:RUS18734.1 P-loop containing nucleoside triphosphate hydrolase protein [Endogone sp. FLAS-F59071]